MIGDAVIDLYRGPDGTSERVGALGNVAGCLDPSAADWVVVTAHPAPDRVARAMRVNDNRTLHVFRLEEAPENIVYYDVRGGSAVCIADEPGPGALSPHATREIEAIIANGGFDVVAVADYGLGVMLPPVRAAVSAHVIAHGGIAFVDSRHADYEGYGEGMFMLPNAAECARLVSATAPTAAARALVARFSAAGVFLKRGSAGLTVLIGGDAFDIPARRVPLNDAAGAGDYLLAELASSVARSALSRATIESAVRRVEGRLSTVGGGLIRPAVVAD